MDQLVVHVIFIHRYPQYLVRHFVECFFDVYDGVVELTRKNIFFISVVSRTLYLFVVSRTFYLFVVPLKPHRSGIARVFNSGRQNDQNSRILMTISLILLAFMEFFESINSIKSGAEKNTEDTMDQTFE